MTGHFIAIDIARSSKLACWVFLTLCLLGVSGVIRADSQRIVDYEYDGAGNITGIHSGRNLGLPAVTALQPGFIHKESLAFITATGINLLKAAVTTTTVGLEILEVTPVSETEVRFTLSADSSAEIGPGLLTFSTRLGSDTETIAIADRTPVIATQPNPIVLAPDGVSVVVKLVFDRPIATNQTYDLLIPDPTIASVSETTVTLIAGEMEVTANATGLASGSTTLEINQLANFLALGIPVIVTDVSLPPGSNSIIANPVGVVVNLEQSSLPPGSSSIAANPVGVVVNFEQSSLPPGSSAITVNPVGVVVNFEQSSLPPGSNSIAANPMGVVVNLDQSLGTNTLILAPQTGLSYGALVEQITPDTVSRSTSVSLLLEGVDLDLVTAINFVPSTGLSITGPIGVNPDGTQLTLPISVASNAPLTARVIILTTPLGDVAPVNPLVIVQ